MWRVSSNLRGRRLHVGGHPDHARTTLDRYAPLPTEWRARETGRAPGGVLIRRLIMLLVASVMLVAACSAPAPDRPRQGAPVGPNGQALQREDANTVPPTLSPYVTPSSTASLNPPSPQPGLALPAGSPSPSPSPLAVGGYVIVATDGAGANMRTGPSTSAPVITTLPEGTEVEVIGDPVTVEGRAWRQIRANGRDGWVVAVVARPRGEVPVTAPRTAAPPAATRPAGTPPAAAPPATAPPAAAPPAATRPAGAPPVILPNVVATPAATPRR